MGLALALIAAVPDANAAVTSIYENAGEWQDDRGQAFSLKSWRGKPTVLAFGYTTCRRVCPVIVKRLLEIQGQLAKAHLPAELAFITIDPQHDTVSKLARFRQTMNIAPDNIHLLRGGEAETRALAQAVDVDYTLLDNHAVHSFKIVFLSASGEVVDSLSWNHSEPEDVQRAINKAAKAP